MTDLELRTWIYPVLDPDIGVSLVGLGLVYNCEYQPETQAVTVTMTLTSPACPMGDHMVGEIKKKLLEHPNVKAAEVHIVWEPKWDPRIMADESAKEVLGLW